MSDERALPVWKHDPKGHWIVAIVGATLVVTSLLMAFTEMSDSEIIALSVGLSLAYFIGNATRLVHQRNDFVRDQATAMSALARGDLKLARDVFWKWSENSISKVMAALARHNLAWTLMRQNDLSFAIAVLTENETRFKKAIRSAGMSSTSALDLALLHALRGDLESAEQWLMTADERKRYANSSSVVAMRAFSRAVIDCRAGRSADASRILEEGWIEFEGLLAGTEVRLLRIVRAFAIAAAGPRNAGLAESHLASIRPTYPEEFVFLGSCWPEMNAFLSSHDLVT